MSISVKFDLHNNQYRRVLLEPSCDYGKVNSIVEEIYQDLPEHWIYSYRDEEGDICLVESDAELKAALCWAQRKRNSTLQLQILEAEEEEDSEDEGSEFGDDCEEEVEEQTVDGFTSEPTFTLVKRFGPLKFSGIEYCGNECSSVVHPAKCNSCGCKIVGIRYKCADKDCADFDMCDACWGNACIIHPAHNFFRVTKPVRLSAPKSRCANPVPATMAEEVKWKPAVPAAMTDVKWKTPAMNETVEECAQEQEEQKEEECCIEAPQTDCVTECDEQEAEAQVAQQEKEEEPCMKYASQVSQLERMGFKDMEVNMVALIGSEGNVQAAVNNLLGTN